MSGDLNARQELFCRHYVLGTSAAAAARAAGYSEGAARAQAWRLLQQPAVQDRITALQGDRADAASALCAQLWEQVEEVRKAALAGKAYGTALRAVVTQMRLFKTLGLPAAPADTQDIIKEGVAAEAASVAGGAAPDSGERTDGKTEALLDRLDELIDAADLGSVAAAGEAARPAKAACAAQDDPSDAPDRETTTSPLPVSAGEEDERAALPAAPVAETRGTAAVLPFADIPQHRPQHRPRASPREALEAGVRVVEFALTATALPGDARSRSGSERLEWRSERDSEIPSGARHRSQARARHDRAEAPSEKAADREPGAGSPNSASDLSGIRARMESIGTPMSKAH